MNEIKIDKKIISILDIESTVISSNSKWNGLHQERKGYNNPPDFILKMDNYAKTDYFSVRIKMDKLPIEFEERLVEMGFIKHAENNKEALKKIKFIDETKIKDLQPGFVRYYHPEKLDLTNDIERTKKIQKLIKFITKEKDIL